MSCLPIQHVRSSLRGHQTMLRVTMHLDVRPLQDFSCDHQGVIARWTGLRFKTIEESLRVA